MPSARRPYNKHVNQAGGCDMSAPSNRDEVSNSTRDIQQQDSPVTSISLVSCKKTEQSPNTNHRVRVRQERGSDLFSEKEIKKKKKKKENLLTQSANPRSSGALEAICLLTAEDPFMDSGIREEGRIISRVGLPGENTPSELIIAPNLGRKTRTAGNRYPVNESAR
ncbi:hypothetical protein CEXT_102461 [Caerostris extrusa]|uniref:Uncharacterized protein n=1 Tax=Caerostris extrusa TaxID=172846 RepID=A0AAV4N5R9_CAEEX|nr:hypothetical protein CEXT_102461 [Caerostris extrusa]